MVQTAVRTNNNDRIEVFRVSLKNGKERWRSETVTRFDANRPGFVPKWRTLDGAQPVAVLRKDDMVVVTDDGRDRIMYVRKFDRNGNILLAEHFESRSDKAVRKQDPDVCKAHFKTVGPETLRKLDARPVHVTPSGRALVRNRSAGSSQPTE